MWLLVGLGNPGPEYARTRHNIGFMAVESIAERHSFSGFSKKFQGEYAEGTLGGERAFLLRPLTFMNLSGNSVAALAQFFKIEPKRIIVLYDDVDLPPGKVRVKQGGGSGGHNGIRSIDAAIGVNYVRVRLGVGKNEHADTAGHVLANFSKAEEKGWVAGVLAAVAEYIPLVVKGDAPLFMTRVSESVKPVKDAAHEQG